MKQQHHPAPQKTNSELLLAWSTVVLALATAVMAFFTYRLAADGKESSRRQIGIQTWLELEKRFDSQEMKIARHKLARNFQSFDPKAHADISETVLDFFEDLGMLYKQGYIDKDLTESSFGYYATRWYEASKPYIADEQKHHGNDATIFENFKYLAGEMKLPKETIDKAEVDKFLGDEDRLFFNDRSY